MPDNHTVILLDGLWQRLARNGRGSMEYRTFVIGEICRLLLEVHHAGL